MKLQSYFTQHKGQYLTDEQRLHTYHQIVHKTMKKSFQKKRSFLHIKSLVYSCFIIFVLVGFYGMYFIEQNQLSDEGIILSQQSNHGNTAKADYIAKVVDFNGTFYVEGKNGEIIQTSNINDGDVVILKENAQLIFHIDTGTKAKLVGPAKFTLQKKGTNSFKLNLLYGEYVEMASIDKKTNQNVELAVGNITVAQGDKTKPLDYQLIKQGENRIIRNSGGKLLISNKGGKTSLGNKQVLAIQGNDVSLFDSFEKFAKAVKDNNLSQTFSLTNTDTPSKTSFNDTGVVASGIKTLNETEILSVEKTSDEITITGVDTVTNMLGNEKKIATPEQITVLRNQVYSEFLDETLASITTSCDSTTDTNCKAVKEDLLKRVSAVAVAFGTKYESAQGLYDYIQKNFSLPPKYLQKFPKIISILARIK